MRLCDLTRLPSCKTGCPFPLPILQRINRKVGCYLQTFQPNCFIPAMRIDTLDLYHFIPLWLMVTRSAEGKPVGFIFLHTCQLNRLMESVEAIQVEHSNTT